MQIERSIPIVTGANRGLGAALIHVLLERGVSKVSAGARDLATLSYTKAHYGEKVVLVELDVTNQDHVISAANTAADADLLISNAGVTCIKPILPEPNIDDFGHAMEVNYFGPLQLLRAFAPVLC